MVQVNAASMADFDMLGNWTKGLNHSRVIYLTGGWKLLDLIVMACRIAILFGVPLLFVAAAPAMAQQAPPPAVEKAAAPILNPPLPLKRPVISERTIPAGALFSQKKWPSVGKPRAIGYYPRGCLQGGVELPIDGANWQVMRAARNRNSGHPV
jgi:hypothetical protein